MLRDFTFTDSSITGSRETSSPVSSICGKCLYLFHLDIHILIVILCSFTYCDQMLDRKQLKRRVILAYSLWSLSQQGRHGGKSLRMLASLYSPLGRRDRWNLVLSWLSPLYLVYDPSLWESATYIQDRS